MGLTQEGSTLDVTSTSFDEVARHGQKSVIKIDAWVEQNGKTGSAVPLYAVQVTLPFFVRTKKGRHEGRAGDFVIENLRQERWVIPQGVFRALFEA